MTTRRRLASGAEGRPGMRARAAVISAALGNRELGLLMVSWLVWITAEWAFLIGVSLLAFDSGGAAAVGLVGALRVLPAAVLGPLVSLASDRLPRPFVLSAVHASWSLVCLATAWLAGADAPVAALLVVTGIGSVTLSAFKPCTNALISQVVHRPSELIVANTAYSTAEGAGTIVGPLLAGTLLATVGQVPTFLVLAGMYAVGAVVSATIRSEFQPARRGQPGRRLLEPLRGFQVLVAQPGTRGVTALMLAQTTMRGLLNVYIVVLALTAFGGGEAQAGSLFAAVGVGGLFGVLASVGAHAGTPTARWFAGGVVLWGLPIVAIGIWPEPVVAWCALAVLGFGNAVEDIFGFSLLGRLIPDHLAGRAFGAFHSGGAAVVAVGSLAAPLLIAVIGLAPAMIVTGAALALAPVLLWPLLRALDEHASADPGDIELLAGVSTFAPMSQIALERLARSAREVRLYDGQPAIRQGEVGDLFYVVADGELVVSQDGRELRRLGPGDSFGEIALLERTRRTATVVARAQCRLLSVDGDSFVAAVTGHRGAELAGRRTVEELLGRTDPAWPDLT